MLPSPVVAHGVEGRELADTNEFRHSLRRERTARGMSQDALGAEIHVSGSQVGNYEAGKQIPPDDIADALDAFLSTGGELKRQARHARGEAIAPWMRSWKANEERAVLLRTFEHSVIPGLLQTEAYARAVITAGLNSDVQIEEMTRDRMARQAKTINRADPVTFSAVIGEAAFRHGDPEIMKDQLEHLVDIGHRPNIHIRVVPFAAGLHAGHSGAFALATLADGLTVAYADDPIDGKVVGAAKDLRHLTLCWESVNARALPCHQSRALILRVIDEYDTDRPNVAHVNP